MITLPTARIEPPAVFAEIQAELSFLDDEDEDEDEDEDWEEDER